MLDMMLLEFKMKYALIDALTCIHGVLELERENCTDFSCWPSLNPPLCSWAVLVLDMIQNVVFCLLVTPYLVSGSKTYWELRARLTTNMDDNDNFLTTDILLAKFLLNAC